MAGSGRKLRALWYDVSAVGNGRAWMPKGQRELLEVDSFRNDYQRVYGVSIPHPNDDRPTFDAAVSKARDDIARFKHLASSTDVESFADSFGWKGQRVRQYLTPHWSDWFDKRSRELLKDPDLDAIDQYLAEELAVFEQAELPRRLLSAARADFERLTRMNATARKEESLAKARKGAGWKRLLPRLLRT